MQTEGRGWHGFSIKEQSNQKRAKLIIHLAPKLPLPYNTCTTPTIAYRSTWTRAPSKACTTPNLAHCSNGTRERWAFPVCRYTRMIVRPSTTGTATRTVLVAY